MLRRLIAVLTLCLLTLPALCEPASKWQIATITEVKPHPVAGEDASDPITYDVSVKVGDTMYLVRYTTPASEIAPKYAAGRDLLVLVGCLLYTSDAADERSSVDLGGRRIIK